MPSKLNSEEFINKSKKIHGNRYDYSKVNYINSSFKVTIGCRKHGYFDQDPSEHLRARGCLLCRLDDRKITLDDFIARSKNIHGDKYIYDKVDYINSRSKVNIGCPIHGYFYQNSFSHLRGYGCVRCVTDKKSSDNENFIIKSNLIHHGNYEYSKVNYKNAFTKVTITCKIHGDFHQIANYHLRGNGCPKCSESKGEKHIANILNIFNINYIREYKIFGYNYRYDFYLPEYNIYIEYHGEQHYKPVDVFGGIKGFRKNVRRDKTKIELIKRSTGILIVIKYIYNDLDKIKNELSQLFLLLHSEFLFNKETGKQSVIDSNLYLINDGLAYKRK